MDMDIRVLMLSLCFAGEPQEIQYTNDILAMISPENEKVSLGKVQEMFVVFTRPIG